MGLSRRVARLGKNEKRGARVGQTAWERRRPCLPVSVSRSSPETPQARAPALPGSLPYRFRICARRSSIAVQSMGGPIGKATMRCSIASKAFSSGGFAYEDDILEDTIL